MSAHDQSGSSPATEDSLAAAATLACDTEERAAPLLPWRRRRQFRAGLKAIRQGLEAGGESGERLLARGKRLMLRAAGSDADDPLRFPAWASLIAEAASAAQNGGEVELRAAVGDRCYEARFEHGGDALRWSLDSQLIDIAFIVRRERLKLSRRHFAAVRHVAERAKAALRCVANVRRVPRRGAPSEAAMHEAFRLGVERVLGAAGERGFRGGTDTLS